MFGGSMRLTIVHVNFPEPYCLCKYQHRKQKNYINFSKWKLTLPNTHIHTLRYIQFLRKKFKYNLNDAEIIAWIQQQQWIVKTQVHMRTIRIMNFHLLIWELSV